ncbi:hypothetical protein D0T25_13265 [Duganella sp. BJB488]|uniref:bpX5 domain-containing protein n=1 Tax=unclassified Duganella TaxID=2636909 RepID=UPI000E352EB2|nr:MULTISPECIES: hypothetical protein [unclassified Duganella]NVD71840.1 hypothetical protein [Duganella sp. BJB1802]RFP17715.1 hypothetical protein D0T26_16010 [Duganella sp. BJB489]RFP22224.1 hypothetical protein D0T25_13265 [Duganella sp. BJB488]RFP37557.1 hypothetical protein D0T24_06110 [Duganella sp. BJB480]
MSVLAWTAREAALAPQGLVSTGAATPRLLAALARREPAELARLSAVATRSLLIVLGANELLPWIDGVRYCAPEPAAPQLWLPTHLAPGLPMDLLQSNLVARAGRSPVLLWNEPELLLPLDQAMALTPALLDWLSRECC